MTNPPGGGVDRVNGDGCNRKEDGFVDWAGIVEQLGDRLLLYARRWAPDEATATDILQEAFLRVWRANEKHPIPEADLSACCHAAVRRAALDHLRSARRRENREAKGGEWLYEAGNPCLPTTLERDEERKALESAMDTLPKEQREVLTLRIWGELTFAEIAATIEESPNTVASRYRLAIAALRKRFAPEEAS